MDQLSWLRSSPQSIRANVWIWFWNSYSIFIFVIMVILIIWYYVTCPVQVQEILWMVVMVLWAVMLCSLLGGSPLSEECITSMNLELISLSLMFVTTCKIMWHQNSDDHSWHQPPWKHQILLEIKWNATELLLCVSESCSIFLISWEAIFIVLFYESRREEYQYWSIFTLTIFHHASLLLHGPCDHASH